MLPGNGHALIATKRFATDDWDVGVADVTGLLEPSKERPRRVFEMARPFGDRLFDRLIAYRIPVLAVLLAIVAAIGFGISFLSFNPDSRLFFGKDNPERLALDALEQTYAKSTNILFVIEPRDGDVFTAQNLASLAEITEGAWQVPRTLRVDSIANFNHAEARGDEIIIEPLYGLQTRLDAAAIDRIRGITLSERELINRLISPDGTVAAVNVQIVKPDDDRDAVLGIAEVARGLARQWEAAYPGVNIRLTGGIIADVTFAEAGQRDLRTLVPVMAVLIVLALVLSLRSPVGVVATVLVIACSAVAAMGFAGWSGMLLNSATAGAPVSIMVLAVASSVHILNSFIQEADRSRDLREALGVSVRKNFAPIVVANVTTAIGFLCLRFSSSPPLREMGTIVAFGVLVCAVLSLTMLPCLLSYTTKVAPQRIRIGARVMAAFGGFVIAYRRRLFWGSIVLMGLAAVGVSRIELDDDYIRYFGKSFAFRIDSEFTERRLTGLNVLQYAVPANGEATVFEPEYLKTLDSFAGWMAEQDGVVAVDSITTLLKRLNRTMNDNDPAFDRIAGSRELNAQYLFLYELSLPVGHDLTDMIDVNRSQSKVTAILADVTSARVRELGHAGEAWLAENAPDHVASTTGVSMVFAYLSQRNIRSMVGGTLLALVLISAILVVALKSPRFGVVSLIPNLVPALLAFGVWGVTFGQINLASSVVTSMTLGIVVDDTVHFLMRYLRLRREGGRDVEGAIRDTFSSVGVALVITSVALTAGFLVLATSGFAINHQVGLLCAITIMAALIADLLFLPTVILAVEKRTMS